MNAGFPRISYTLGGFYEKNYFNRRRYCRTRYPQSGPAPFVKGSWLRNPLYRFIPGHGRKLIETAGIPYDGISSGKLRRYFDIKNFSDPFRVVKGYAEARRLLKRHKPDVIFSKGGFVAVPVVLAAKHYKIPVIIHESDMTPGLANKICIPSALNVCCNFPETLKYLPSDKAVLTGSPIRAELLQGDRLSGLSYAHLSAGRPVLLVIGGSLGSVAVNTAVRNILPRLLSSYQVIHICGKGNLDESLIGTAGYVQYEYVDAPLKHLLRQPTLSYQGQGLILSASSWHCANRTCLFLCQPRPAAETRFSMLTPLQNKDSARFWKKKHCLMTPCLMPLTIYT